MNIKVCLLIPYYGKLPFWMPAFYLSCKHNPSIKWIIFTDNSPPDHFPPNVEFINLSLEHLNSVINEKMGLEVRIDKQYAYKLCDFKPAYGLIFDEYIKGYDYWGHCDLDTVWGDIESFIDKEKLLKYDIFTTRINKIAGHWCLYRNIEEVNDLFKKINHLTLSLSKVDQYCGVDEKYLSRLLLNLTKPNVFTKLARRISGGDTFIPKVYWDKILAPPGKYQRQLWDDEYSGFLWKNGKVFHFDGEELMYIHFHKLKPNMKEIDFEYADNPSAFQIKNSGIFRC